MAEFPRTTVEEVSLPRMIIGTNWFCGYSHTSDAKDKFLKARQDPKDIADIIEVFMRAGVDAILGKLTEDYMLAAIKEAEDRTGRGCIRIGTPDFEVTSGASLASIEKVLDEQAKHGTVICMPHQCTVDALIDPINDRIRDMDQYSAMIRERGMIPGLSTHRPEAVIYADESGLDVGTYIQLYNAAGFLMHLEVDWIHRIIWNAKKPVLTIKPMAAGRLLPLVGMGFVWGTIREQDMVCVGTMTPDEARELIDLSMALLEHRGSTVELQKTRSKRSVLPKAGT